LDVIGQELFGGVGVALLDGTQDARHFTHRRHREGDAKRLAAV
jgi:hypothetical protein